MGHPLTTTPQSSPDVKIKGTSSNMLEVQDPFFCKSGMVTHLNWTPWTPSLAGGKYGTMKSQDLCEGSVREWNKLTKLN